MSEQSFNELDVTGLSDDELYNRLSSLGATLGPIVDSTRRVYQKKLIRLMGGDVVDSSFGEVADDEEGYSDADQQPQTSSNVSSYSAAKPSAFISESSPSLRSRAVAAEQTYRSEKYSPPTPSNFDHDRHTPSPRPSLRTVTSSTKYTTSGGGSFRETRSTSYVTSEAARGQTDDDTSNLTRLLVKCLIIVILIIALYGTYQYVYQESPFKGLQELAKEALDSAESPAKKAAKKAASKK